MIRVSLKSSRRLLLLLAAAHLGAIFAILDLPVPAKIGLIGLLSFHMIYAIVHHALLLLPSSVVSLKIGEKGGTFLQRDGRERSFSILGSSYVSPYLTILNMKVEGARLSKSAVILGDAADREEFRQLRVWLRWKT